MGRHAHPEIALHTISLATYEQFLDDGNWQGVADLMLDSSAKLARAGADFLICPDNTIHQAFDLVEQHTPLPWLHIAREVACHAVERGFQRLALTGTRWLVASDVYPGQLQPRGLECMRPTESEIANIHRIICDELVNGLFLPESVKVFQRCIARMQSMGCDAVILGCTEIPLLIDDSNSPLPVLDSTRLLAHAALREALA